jgi:hypothetical protein
MLKISAKNLSCFLLLLSSVCLKMPIAQAQETTSNETSPPVEEQIRPGMVLSLEGGEKLLKEAKQAIDSQNYDLAVERLQGGRQLFNQLSNFYIQLSQNFTGIDSKITEEAKKKAFQSGQKRDETTYQLALVHRAQSKPELAVPLLLQVIRSQNPTSELGKKAYQQLYEIGFINIPFAR